MPFFIKKFIFPILCFISAFFIIIYFIAQYQKTNTSVNYVLKTYKNTVALYNGEEIIKVYNSIVLNTLPQKDIESFNNGIPVSTKSQADSYLEDFDS